MLSNITILWTDALIFILIFSILFFVWRVRNNKTVISSWKTLLRQPFGMSAMVILLFFIGIGLLDSLHYRVNATAQERNTNMISLLDKALSPLGVGYEKTYSAPFAYHLFVKEVVIDDNGLHQQIYPHLDYVDKAINTSAKRNKTILIASAFATAKAVLFWLIVCLSLLLLSQRKSKKPLADRLKALCHGEADIAWRSILITLLFMLVLISNFYDLSRLYHIFGTDKIGQDVFYQAVKSIRTGLVIGTLTTFVMLPLAIFFGTTAGYFGKRIDDIVQYIYTTLNSIPGVLLIAASILALQVLITNNPTLFPTLEARADIRLLGLCIILGITTWTTLCRLLRGESLKLREVDYVQAARCLGASNTRIIIRHILPNVMHIIIITIVLEFSSLVLIEAVLSYVGVGVDLITYSWGNMINAARLELAREPIVWWPITSAFVFMFTLVLSANIFADSVRDAFDPRRER